MKFTIICLLNCSFQLLTHFNDKFKTDPEIKIRAQLSSGGLESETKTD